jgi:hypothetical protein
MKKNFTLIRFYAFLLSLSLFGSGVLLTTSAVAQGSPSLCSNCDNNKLENWSFESNLSNWNTVKSGTSAVALARESSYKVCGNSGATFSGYGYFYQDVANVLPGSIATLRVYGARHDDFNQRFQIIFLSASGEALATKSVKIDKNVNSDPWGLKLYTLTSDPAPAGTTKVRVRGIQDNKDGWIKVDAVCLTISYCEDCVNNRLTNGGFENGLTGWSKSGGTLETNPTYAVCGSKGATFSGSGYFYQDVTGVIEGSVATLSIWGARHENYNQKFQIVFLNASGGEIASSLKSVNITKDVNDAPWGLNKYTLVSDPAPAGTAKIRVKGIQNNGSAWIKVDQACLTITDPCGCEGNKLANGSFESGTLDWQKTDGTNYSVETSSKGCGTKYGVITGTGSIYQEFDIKGKSRIDLIIWGGTDNVSLDHKFKITYYRTGNTVINTGNANETIDVNHAIVDNFLAKYTFLTSTAPDAAVKVRIEAIAANGTTTKFKVDGACLRIAPPDGPLPVTLTDFTVTKENSTAALTWSTTSETNASEFEVQHSENGKAWNKIGSVEAIGESVNLFRYNFVHENPATGDNFYRLKMVDLDNTYAMSRIVTVNFENVASVQVYPNPTSDFMKLTLGKEKIRNVQLYNIQGRMVLENTAGMSDVLDIRSLIPGSYIVKIKQTSGTTTTHRLQVVR